MICPKCGRSMFKEHLPPSNQYVREFIGSYVYNCLYCGKEVYVHTSSLDSLKRERKVRLRRYVEDVS